MACMATRLTLWDTLTRPCSLGSQRVIKKKCCQWHIAHPFEVTSLEFGFSLSLTAALLHTAVEKLMLFKAGGACE